MGTNPQGEQSSEWFTLFKRGVTSAYDCGHSGLPSGDYIDMKAWSLQTHQRRSIRYNS
jgi:hypothetical protein